MFSGQKQIGQFIAGWQGISIAVLAGSAFLKAVITPLCVGCDWKGGIIFPLIFVGGALGFAIAALTGADAMICCTVTSAILLGSVTGKFFLSVLLLLLVFPVRNILWIAIGARLGAVLPRPGRVYKRRTGRDR